MAAFYKCLILVGVILGLFDLINGQLPKKEISIVSVVHPPYMYKGSTGHFSGFIPDLLNEISETIGINYTLYESPDGTFGSFVNGSWNGMMKEIQDGTADIGGPLTVTHYRSKYVYFSNPVQYVEFSVVMKKPEKDRPSLKENLSKLLYPLEFSVWLMAFLALLVTGTVLYIISHFNPYEWRRMAKDREATLREAESFTCLNSFFFVVSTLMWQGYVRAPRSVGARVMVVAWWSFTVVFLLTYTASLTNYLRSPPEPFAAKGYSKIKSFRDLAHNEETRVGMFPSGATMVHYKQSTAQTDMKIYEKFLEERQAQHAAGEMLNSLADLENYLRQRTYSDYAVILETPYAKFVTSKEPCDLYMITDGTAKRHLSFAMKNGSWLQPLVDLAILKLRESGTLQHLERTWFSSGCKQHIHQMDDEIDYSEMTPFKQLDLGTFSSALLIIVVGIVLGGLISIIEICIYKWAETHVDEEEAEPVSNRNSKSFEPESTDRLLNQDSKKGGATQV